MMIRDWKTIMAMIAVPAAGLVFAESDDLDRVKKRMSEAGCCRFQFLAVVESDVFDSVDSTRGEAFIARDGRYAIALGADVYAFDGEFLFAYSQPNNQVTVEKVDPAVAPAEHISFITRLDQFYLGARLKESSEYALKRIDSAATGLPDSLTLKVQRNGEGIEWLEYFDINSDRNRIVFERQDFLEGCPPERFHPAFPDSVEYIKLY